ncbi:MAG: hypothetical protein COB54_05130 [Alphaproteobacteria bacterium]|nr:MAG: hypothetical protein COB54_05130 [Alphaproteobacteria bacterium]
MSQIRRQSVPPLSEKVQKRLKQMVKKARYGSRLHEYRLKGKHPLRLLGTPKDPWAGSVAAGSHILANRFYCEGHILRNPGPDSGDEKGDWPDGSVWQATDLSLHWQRHLQSFSWLRDLNRAVDRKAARDKAMALTGGWLEKFDTWQELAWAPDILGQRLVHWMAYAPLILDSTDLVYRSTLLNCLARQARHLYQAADDPLRGLARFQAIGGLVMAGLYVPYGESWLKKGTTLLKAALAQEILADGGLRSRNPEDLYQVLRVLLLVRASYRRMGHAIPDPLAAALPRMIALLKSLLLGDGRLASFNGSRPQSARDMADLLDFATDINETPPQLDAEKSGFRRLHQGTTVVILDSGPPADRDFSPACHAGTLSFEMSSGKQRLIVNCGSAGPLGGGAEADIVRLSRSTAAHSTLILNDKNSSEICPDGLIGYGPSLVSSLRTVTDGHSLLETSHDGYLGRFGLMHYRTLYMNEAGDDIRGEDVVERQKNSGKFAAMTPKFDLRFHLHPGVTVTRQGTAEGAADRLLLSLSGFGSGPGSELGSGRQSEFWQFHCSGAELAVEESLYLGQGARRQSSRQIVLSGRVRDIKTVIKWSLHRIDHQ